MHGPPPTPDEFEAIRRRYVYAPYLAHLAAQTVPALISVLFFLTTARLFWPTRRRR